MRTNTVTKISRHNIRKFSCQSNSLWRMSKASMVTVHQVATHTHTHTYPHHLMTTRTLHTLQTTSTVHYVACSGDTLAFTLHLATTHQYSSHTIIFCVALLVRAPILLLIQPASHTASGDSNMHSTVHTLSLRTTFYCYRWWQHINRFGPWIDWELGCTLTQHQL